MVEAGDRRVELRDHVDRRAGDHRVHVARERRVDVRGERQRPGGRRDEVRGQPPGALGERGPTAHRPRGHRQHRRPHPGEQIRQAEVQIGQVAAGRRDQRDADDPGPKSSGPASASAMIVMPPIECPTSTIGPPGTRASRTAASRRRAADGRVLGFARPDARARAGRRRPAGRGRCPLAVASSAARFRRWNVGRHGQRVAVHEDDGAGFPPARLLDREQVAVVGLTSASVGGRVANHVARSGHRGLQRLAHRGPLDRAGRGRPPRRHRRRRRPRPASPRRRGPDGVRRRCGWSS